MQEAFDQFYNSPDAYSAVIPCRRYISQLATRIVEALLAVGGGLGVDGGLEVLSRLLDPAGSLGGDDEGTVLVGLNANGLQS